MNLRSDVVITGGGLAGLGLALQLKQASPSIDIIVIEKNTFPRPRAIAKVGESTVEIGSHYLAKHLDLEAHLRKDHLKKFGIRMFFGEPAADFSQQDELGASQTFGIPTYQIDRGDLENHLQQKVLAQGTRIISGASVQNVSLTATQQTVSITSTEHGAATITGRWLLDASGRRALVKNAKQLQQKNAHKSHAIWFRIDRKIEIDSWSSNTDWQQRCMPEGKRWLSTNHLVGPGYWVWIIPLASGVTSIGIVMDEQAFTDGAIQCEASTMRWLHQQQARCAEAIDGAKFLDFVVLQDYSYDCKQVMSHEGWGITGEAGRFADPLYSPGSDFIAISNCFLTSLVSADMQGQNTQINAVVLDRLYRSIYDNTLSLYTGQYGGFGDRQMMGLKLLWDYSYYWGVLSLLFFRDALTDLNMMRELSPMLHAAQALNQQVQARFRQRAEQRLVLPNRGVFMDQYQIPCLQHFNQVLMASPTGRLEDIQSDLKETMTILSQVAQSVEQMLSDAPSLVISDGEQEILGDYRMRILAE